MTNEKTVTAPFVDQFHPTNMRIFARFPPVLSGAVPVGRFGHFGTPQAAFSW